MWLRMLSDQIYLTEIKGLKSFVKGMFVGKILWSDRPTQCPANNAAIDLFSYESELFRNFFLKRFFKSSSHSLPG